MALDPNFADAPVAYGAKLTAANTALDGSGTLVDVIGVRTRPTRVDRIELQAAAATTAGIVRLFLDDGTNVRLWREVTVGAVTPSATNPAWSAAIFNGADPSQPLINLPPAWKLRATTTIAQAINVLVPLAGTYS